MLQLQRYGKTLENVRLFRYADIRNIRYLQSSTGSILCRIILKKTKTAKKILNAHYPTVTIERRQQFNLN